MRPRAARRNAGHIAKYHCLNATSPNGFLTGADTPRDLAQEYRCFNPSGLKHRWYYHNWDWGHRYVLNLARSRDVHALLSQPGQGTQVLRAEPRQGSGSGQYTLPHPRQRGLDVSAAADSGGIPALRPVGDGRRKRFRPPDCSRREPARRPPSCSRSSRPTSPPARRSTPISSGDPRATRPTIEISTNNGLTWTKVWQAAEAGPACRRSWS